MGRVSAEGETSQVATRAAVQIEPSRLSRDRMLALGAGSEFNEGGEFTAICTTQSS